MNQTRIEPCEFCGEPSVEELELIPEVTESREGAIVQTVRPRTRHVCAQHAESIRGGVRLAGADEGQEPPPDTGGQEAPRMRPAESLVTGESRTFRIRACPECGRVDMPHYRDDRPYCKEPPKVHGGRSVRLAWFDVGELPTRANALNQEARHGAEPGRGYVEYARPYDGKLFWRNWATGERGLVDA